MAEKVERRLTVIFSADVVAYARLMGADEAGTRVALKSHRQELIDPKLAEHQGRLVSTAGDITRKHRARSSDGTRP
jgi:adenylate cyclase